MFEELPEAETEERPESTQPPTQPQDSAHFDSVTRRERIRERVQFDETIDKRVELGMNVRKVLEEQKDPNLQELGEKVREFCRESEIPEGIADIYEKSFQTLEERRASINQFMEQVPDDKEAFEKIFGEKPQGPVRKVVMPATLCFVCENGNDYATAYASGMPGTYSDKAKEYIKKNDAGAYLPVLGEDYSLEGTITLVNGEINAGVGIEESASHEDEHAMSTIFHVKNEQSYASLNMDHALSSALENPESQTAVINTAHAALRMLRSESRIQYVISPEFISRTEDGDLFYKMSENPEKASIFLNNMRERYLLPEGDDFITYPRRKIRKLTEYIDKRIEVTQPNLDSEEIDRFKKAVIKQCETDYGAIFMTEMEKKMPEYFAAAIILKDKGYSPQEAATIFQVTPSDYWKKTAEDIKPKTQTEAS